LTLAEFEREVTFHLDDLDTALALMVKMADLYPRLDGKQQNTLLQILAKRIIVDPQGEILEHELNSPFVYLRSLLQRLSTSGNGKGGSENIPLEAPKGIHPKLHTLVEEPFIAALRFERRGKLAELLPNRK
jgi:hypothetical protein